MANLLAVGIAVLFFGSSNADDGPIVQTSYGPIRGYTFTSPWTGQEISAFTGVPYASPPVGNLRFKKPEFPQKWTLVNNFTGSKPSCVQPIDPVLVKLNPNFRISEDCLYLNIYTPKVIPNVMLPVMVFIHGGGFIKGSGDQFLFGPDFFVADGVILVTLNYRLGVFGFLNLNTPSVPGNAGLKDQRLALRWVQQEIVKFGGDPGRVTIFGASAGAASVNIHYLSPSSKGLFHRAIIQSGSSLVRTRILEKSLKLASNLNCSREDINLTEACLQQISPDDLLMAQWLLEPNDGAVYGSCSFFNPSIENARVTDAVIPELLSDMVEKKYGSYVPILMGINSEDGQIVLSGLSDDFIGNFTNNLDRLILSKIKTDSKVELNNFVQKLNTHYFKDSKDLRDVATSIVNVYTDISFAYNTALNAKLYRTRNNVYLYYFTFDSTFKEQWILDLDSKFNLTGASHGDELSFMFVRSDVNQTAPPDSLEMKTWRRVVRMWTNFAKFGKPTGEPDPLLQNVSWEPVGPTSTPYLRIGGDLAIEAGAFMGPSVAFWDSLMSSSTSLTIHTTGIMGITLATGCFVWLFYRTL